jgi:biotin carboxyl carrier protein
MYKVKHGQRSVDVEFSSDDKLRGKLNGKPFEADLAVDGRFMHLLKDSKNFSAEIISVDRDNRTVSILLNGKPIQLNVSTRLDELIERMGFSDSTSRKIAELKAPMPGLVLSVIAEEGQTIRKGEAILVLEAMKMENIIKASADVVIKQVKIKKGQAVEKNQVLVTFA